MKKSLGMVLASVLVLVCSFGAFAGQVVVIDTKGSMAKMSGARIPEGFTKLENLPGIWLVDEKMVDSLPSGVVVKKNVPMKPQIVRERSGRVVNGREARADSTPWQRVPLAGLLSRGASRDYSNIVIFIVDTGYNDKKDLEGRILTEYSRVFLDDPNATLEDEYLHGTGAALTAAGKEYGACPFVNIVPIRVAKKDGMMDNYSEEKAFDYIIGLKKGVFADKKIIVNLSFGGMNSVGAYIDPDNGLDVILREFQKNDILFINAAGNENLNTDVVSHDSDVNEDYIHTWATFENPTMMSAGALQEDGNPASYSNYGQFSVETFVPADMVVVPAMEKGNDEPNFFAGTSAASPYLAGMSAHVWAAYPNLKAWQVRNILIKASKLAAGTADWKTCIAMSALDIGNVDLKGDYAGTAPEFVEIKPRTDGTNRPYRPFELSKVGSTYSWKAFHIDGRPMTYDVLIDGKQVVSGLTDTTYTYAAKTDGDSRATAGEWSVRASDGSRMSTSPVISDIVPPAPTIAPSAAPTTAPAQGGGGGGCNAAGNVLPVFFLVIPLLLLKKTA